MDKFKVEIHASLSEYKIVKVAVRKSKKNEAELLDHATNNLLRAVKARMIKREGRVNYDKLRKEGYSERFLAKFEQA